MQGFCSQLLGGHTFHVYKSNVLDNCMHGHHNQPFNFLDVGRHVLLELDNCCFFRNFHGLHSLSTLAVVRQHIAAVWPASASASAAVVLPTADDYSVPRLPHVRVSPKQLQESQSGLAISIRPLVVLKPHHGPCLRGALPYPAW